MFPKQSIINVQPQTQFNLQKPKNLQQTNFHFINLSLIKNNSSKTQLIPGKNYHYYKSSNDVTYLFVALGLFSNQSNITSMTENIQLQLKKIISSKSQLVPETKYFYCYYSNDVTYVFVALGLLPTTKVTLVMPIWRQVTWQTWRSEQVPLATSCSCRVTRSSSGSSISTKRKLRH